MMGDEDEGMAMHGDMPMHQMMHGDESEDE